MRLIPAYTIIEVTLALAISALTMTFMFKGKLFFEKLFVTHQRVEMEILELNLLDKSLRKDFFYSEDVKWDENRLVFHYPLDSLVSYVFINEKIVKHTNNNLDTFDIHGVQENKLISRHISNFRIRMMLTNRQVVYTYKKKYSAYQKMKLKL